DRRPDHPAPPASAHAARARAACDRGRPGHGGARRRRRSSRLRARDGDRRRRRGARRRLLRDESELRPVRGPDAAHLRVRGGRHRRYGLALGDARLRRRARGRADGVGADRRPVLPARRAPRVPRGARGARGRAGVRARAAAARRSRGGSMNAVAAPAARVERWTLLSASFTAGLAALLALLAFAPLVLGDNSIDNLIQLYFLVVLAIMWNALAGYGGLVSVGQQAFIGIGAYGTVFLSVQHSLNPYLSMLLATLIGGAVAVPVAAIVLWLRGGAFAIATWVVAEIFAILVSLDSALGGGTGTSAVLAFNLRYSPEQRLRYTYWAALAAAAVLLAVLFLLLRSRLGASLQAIRDDEDAARSLGVRVLLGKGVLFVLAGAGCAAAGSVILAWQLSIIALGPDSVFGVNWSAKMIFMVLVGGLGTFEGPIIGAVILFLLQTYVSNSGVWYFVTLGSIAIAVALVIPRGIWGTLQSRYELQLLPVGY